MSKGDTFKAATIGRYMFSLQEQGTATYVGDAPEGARFDVLYATAGGVSAAYTDVERWRGDWERELSSESSIAVPTASGGKPQERRLRTDLDDLREALSYLIAKNQGLTRDEEPIPDGLARQTEKIKEFADALALQTGDAQPNKVWLGFDAKVVSGSDWLLVRDDGVAELSGRVTFKSKDQPDEALVNMVVAGAVDLNAAPGVQLAQTLATAVKIGLPFAVAATFEAGRTAPSWAPSGMQRQAAGFWKYQPLTRAQFLLVGVVTPLDGTLGSTTEMGIMINADVFEVRRPNGVPQTYWPKRETS
jgi:hypothetical protein